MLDNIIHAALRNRLIVLLAGFALLLAGAYTVVQIPVDVFPDLTAPTVVILTEAHGMASEEVEMLVTYPVETAVNGATGVRRVRSSSATGISIVWVEFDWGTDIFLARQIVSEKVQLVAGQLPKGLAAPVLAPVSSIMGEIMLVSVSSDRHSELDVRGVADWTIRTRLLAVPGVSQVVPIGGGRKQYQVEVNPDALLLYGVTLEQVTAAVSASNATSSGGVFMEKGQEYLIRGLGRVYNVADIEAAVVATHDGVPVRVGDVARVVIAAAPKIGDASVNGKDAVVISIQKQPGANTLELTERIEHVLEETQRSLPPGMEINTHIFRQADFISTSIGNVVGALRDGAVLVIVILLIFLGNFRTSFISLAAMPLSLIFALFVLTWFDFSINTMTLGGMAIAIGAIVDDAIIDVENVFRRLKENAGLNDGDRRPAVVVIFEASREIRSSIVNATLIIIVVFLPVFFLGGVEGRMLRPLGIAYIASIASSLLVALTITPVLCSYLLPKLPFLQKHAETRFIRILKRVYGATLDAVIAAPGRVLLGAGLVFVLSLALLPFLGRSFLPEFNEGSLTLSVITVPGTSLEESNTLGRMVESILLAHPCITSTARRTGRAELDEHAQGVNSAEIDARFTLDGRSREQMLGELRHALSIVPGANITIGQPLGHRIDHMLSGTRANIAVKIFGDDLERLKALGHEVRGLMGGVPGVVDLALEEQLSVPQIRVKPDRARLARHGMSVAAFLETIDIAFSGEVVSQIVEGQQSFDLLVWYNENHRGSLANIRRAMIDVPSGGMVPITELAEVVSEKGINAVSRENVRRKMVVQANVADRDLSSVITDIQARVAASLSLPEGYTIEYGGQFESEQQASKVIMLLSIVAVLLIVVILYLEFRSLQKTVLIMVNLPLALIGGIAAVALTGGIISIASLIGFITLFGIATRNGILMVSHYGHLADEGLSLAAAVRQGSLERLNPVMMTALSAGLALVPLALSAGEPGSEIQAPLAVVILGGLLTSTALNMIVIPALYVRFMPDTSSK
ncbi:MAG: efflux RND transporter permease subunit [Ignavibacteriae bacterium]|nr:efflux RND transporter permease subunit [Ignavibacteriota bacterium]